MQKQSRVVLVLIVAFASTFAHALALTSASAEGLLLETLTATESRQRTRDNPENRQKEDRALSLANLAYADMALATSPISFELEGCADQREGPDFPELALIHPASGLASLEGARAPPPDLSSAPPPDGGFETFAFVQGVSSRVAAPRAPPSML